MQRTALITGGANGLGRAYAERLAADGLHVVIADIADAAEAVESIRSAGGEAEARHCDLTDERSIHGLVADLGERQADVLVHNAGTYPLCKFEDLEFEVWRSMMAIHLDALFHLCHELLPQMRARGWGRIIGVSSDLVFSSVPGLSHYTTAKAGVVGFMRSLATEVGVDGVTANVVAPGLVETPGTLAGGRKEAGLFDEYLENQAIKRTLTPADLVGAISFLASEDAGAITGQTLLVNGGWAFN